MAHSSAFTSVTSRRSLKQSNDVVNSPTPPSTSSKANFSPEVREYVQRAFANQPSSVTKPEIDAKLKEIIGQAMKNKVIDQIDWSQHSLPHEIIRQEREMAKALQSKQGTHASFTNSQQEYKPQLVNRATDKDKKRKSSDFEDNSVPVAKRLNSRESPEKIMPKPESLNARITGDSRPLSKREQKKQRKMQVETDLLQDEAKASGDLEKRRKRFGLGNESAPLDSPFTSLRVPPVNHGPVVGTNQSLEKHYLRLTAPPKPETVRPLNVLRQTLDLLMNKWRLERNYGYVLNQFKSLRQDLTVQHIKNEFTVTVYERHARIALENGDMGEYNQCQSQLRMLYKDKLGGNPGEFLAYRILYFLFTRNRGDITNVLGDVPHKYRNAPEVKHALRTRSALALGNFHQFFRLYQETPNHGAWLMDMFIDRERLAAFAALCKLYLTIDVKTVTAELAFESEMECCDFICKYGGSEFLERQESTGMVVLKAKQAGPAFESNRRAAFRSVDIKGQI